MALAFRLCVFYGFQNRQRNLPYAALADFVRITEVENVYCAVRTKSLYEGDSNENLKSAIKIKKTVRLSCKLTVMILMV
jgi:hypothetical protein